MRLQKIVRLIAIGGFGFALFSMTTEAKSKVTNQPFGKNARRNSDRTLSLESRGLRSSNHDLGRNCSFPQSA